MSWPVRWVWQRVLNYELSLVVVDLVSGGTRSGRKSSVAQTNGVSTAAMVPPSAKHARHWLRNCRMGATHCGWMYGARAAKSRSKRATVSRNASVVPVSAQARLCMCVFHCAESECTSTP